MNEPWIETNSGILFPFLNPREEHVNIGDIAHALSLNCRFVGQCRKFYSVAEHSWHVSRMLEGCPIDIQLGGLLHDGSEAYITDVASPVKAYLSGYQEIEDGIQAVIFSKYGLEYPLHPAIKAADRAMLSMEAQQLMPGRGDNWEMWKHTKRPVVQPAYRPVGMAPEHAEECFLDKFSELMTELRRERKRETNGQAPAN